VTPHTHLKREEREDKICEIREKTKIKVTSHRISFLTPTSVQLTTTVRRTRFSVSTFFPSLAVVDYNAYITKEKKRIWKKKKKKE